MRICQISLLVQQMEQFECLNKQICHSRIWVLIFQSTEKLIGRLVDNENNGTLVQIVNLRSFQVLFKVVQRTGGRALMCRTRSKQTRISTLERLRIAHLPFRWLLCSAWRGHGFSCTESGSCFFKFSLCGRPWEWPLCCCSTCPPAHTHTHTHSCMRMDDSVEAASGSLTCPGRRVIQFCCRRRRGIQSHHVL